MPNDTLELYGVEIPNRDWLSGEETERLELLTKTDISQTRADIEVIAIFADTRAGKRLNVDKLMKDRLPENLGDAVKELTAPFLQWRMNNARRNLRTQLDYFEVPALQKAERELTDDLEKVRKLIESKTSENDGSTPKPS